MRSFGGAVVAGPPPASNRRQPIRQTRTKPVRTASIAVQPGAAQAADDVNDESPGFYPAISHFTDAITALPKEMVRHYTMLKEVDAKIYGPEEVLGQLFDDALKPSCLSHKDTSQSHPERDAKTNSTISSQPGTEESINQSDLKRRSLFHNMRVVMNEMLTTLDEKNHVLNTTIDSLDRQLKRCKSSYPYIENEISEEARYGSLTHWAYSTEKSAEKKGMMTSERTRRAANNLAAQQAAYETEGASLRSEVRREVVAVRKQRNQNLDSDFDGGRVIGKRARDGGKDRRTGDAGVASGVAPPNKRRKVEKSALGGLSAEKAMASVFGNNGSTRGTAVSPVGMPLIDISTKKKARGGAVANGNTMRRGNTNASAANSPSMASSPVVGAFPAPTNRRGRSPAPPLQRMPSSRARQNSTQSVTQLAQNRSSSTNQVASNGNGLHGTKADVDKVSGLTGRTIGDVKSSMKEAVNETGEHLIEDVTGSDGAGDMCVVGSRAMKREETECGNGRTRAERPVSISTRGGAGSKQPSKTATPIAATFAEPSRLRTSRAADGPAKRSHKKGAGLAAQLAAAAAADEEGSLHGEEDEEGNPNEPRYCYCNRVSYGEMVGCDGDDCPREWFHLECVGLTRPPSKTAKWYCDECKDTVKKSKFNGGNGK